MAAESRIQKQVKRCRNPLVIALPVAIYDPGAFPSLEGPKVDCQAIAFGMNYKRGNSVWYFDHKNKLVEVDESKWSSSNDHSKFTGIPDFKLRWNDGDVKLFIDEILQKLEMLQIMKDKDKNKNDNINNDKNNNSNSIKNSKFDGLLFFISGHGGQNGVFYDSNGNDIDIKREIFCRFEHRNCKYFRGKPKVFIADCCRGSRVLAKLANKNLDLIKNDLSPNESTTLTAKTPPPCSPHNPHSQHRSSSTGGAEEDKKQEKGKEKIQPELEMKEENVTSNVPASTPSKNIPPKAVIPHNINRHAQKNSQLRAEERHPLSLKSYIGSDACLTSGMMTSNINSITASGRFSDDDAERDMRYIFGNPEGFSAVDSTFGGYLTRSILGVLCRNENIGKNKQIQFDNLVVTSHSLMHRLIGDYAAQLIEDENHWGGYDITLESKEARETNIEFNENDGKYYEVTASGREAMVFESMTQFSGVATIQIKNPLVVMLIIGDYSLSRGENSKVADSEKESKDSKDSKESEDSKDNKDDDDDIGESCEDINKNGLVIEQCMITEYLNVRRGYSILYKTRNGTVRHYAKAKNANNVKDKFKLLWTYEDIESYNEEIANFLKNNNKQYNYDGLLYFISGHGADGNILYSSDGWDYCLEFIFDKFNNTNCSALRNLPKIFFMEMGRSELQDSYSEELYMVGAPKSGDNVKNLNGNISARNTINRGNTTSGIGRSGRGAKRGQGRNGKKFTPMTLLSTIDETKSSRGGGMNSSGMNNSDKNSSRKNDSSGVNSSCMNSSGMNSSDKNRYDKNNSGTNSSDKNSIDKNSSGINSGDTNTNDTNSNDKNSSEINSSGTNNSGINSSDKNSTDKNNSETKPMNTNSSDRNGNSKSINDKRKFKSVSKIKNKSKYVNHSDMVFVYSCDSNQNGGIRAKAGSVFFNQVCKVCGKPDFEKHDLIAIIGNVQSRVKSHTEHHKINGRVARHLPVYVNRIRHKIYFKSKKPIQTTKNKK